MQNILKNCKNSCFLIPAIVVINVGAAFSVSQSADNSRQNVSTIRLITKMEHNFLKKILQISKELTAGPKKSIGCLPIKRLIWSWISAIVVILIRMTNKHEATWIIFPISACTSHECVAFPPSPPLSFFCANVSAMERTRWEKFWKSPSKIVACKSRMYNSEYCLRF